MRTTKISITIYSATISESLKMFLELIPKIGITLMTGKPKQVGREGGMLKGKRSHGRKEECFYTIERDTI